MARQARQQKREACKQQQRSVKKAKKKAKQGAKAREADGKVSTAQPKKVRARTSVQKAEDAKARAHRVSTRGLAELSTLWLKGQNRLPQHLHPEPWPPLCHSVSTLTEEDFLAQQK